jgi:hypothetical protein
MPSTTKQLKEKSMITHKPRSIQMIQLGTGGLFFVGCLYAYVTGIDFVFNVFTESTNQLTNGLYGIGALVVGMAFLYIAEILWQKSMFITTVLIGPARVHIALPNKRGSGYEFAMQLDKGLHKNPARGIAIRNTLEQKEALAIFHVAVRYLMRLEHPDFDPQQWIMAVPTVRAENKHGRGSALFVFKANPHADYHPQAFVSWPPEKTDE